MKDRVKELAEKNSKKVNAGLPPTQAFLRKNRAEALAVLDVQTL